MKKNLLLIVSIISIFMGCSPIIDKYSIQINTITAPNLKVTPTTYIIKSLGKDTDPNGLEFQHNVEKLNQSLREKGYKEVENLNSAEEIIYFDYGIEKEFERVERYRQPDVGFAISVGNSYHHRYSPFWSEFGYTHYTTYQKRRIYYNRYITILSKKPQGKELWRVDASTIGESKNLKKIVPMLIEASVDYIGKNSEEPIKIIMKEKLEKKIDKKE